MMSSTIWRSSHPVISPRCVHAWRGARLSGRLGTVAVHREWVAGRRYTVVAYCELLVDWRCPVAVLQNPCPHVLLMSRPLHVSHARGISLVVWHLGRYVHVPMGDHDGNATRGYLFTSVAHSP
jgi:hypothetical protein